MFRGAGIEVFDTERLTQILDELASVSCQTKLVVVVGGENIIRGHDLTKRLDMAPVLADDIVTIATILNACVVSGLLTSRKVPNTMVSANNVGNLIPGHVRFSPENIQKFLNRGDIVVVGGGIGRSRSGLDTDTIAVLLAYALKADILLKGGCIFSAVALKELTVPLRVFDILTRGSLRAIISGKPIGSLFTPTSALTA